MEKDCQNCGLRSQQIFSAEAKGFKKNRGSKPSGLKNVCERCKQCYEKRNEHLEAIISSNHNKRLIIAGPGTGKTHTFKKVLEKIASTGSSVVFTLINNLADDLKDSLRELGNPNIKATTFHGFC